MLLRYLLSSSSNVLTTSSQTSLYVWGKNGEGQLGDGTTVNKSQPVSISNFIKGSSITMISSGNGHSLLLDASGKLWGWGDNAYGQLGDNTTNDSSSALLIPAQDTTQDYTYDRFTDAVSSLNGGIAINSSDGSAWVWGGKSNTYISSTAVEEDSAAFLNYPYPTKLRKFDKYHSPSFSQVAAGDSILAGITTDGRLLTATTRASTDAINRSTATISALQTGLGLSNTKTILTSQEYFTETPILEMFEWDMIVNGVNFSAGIRKSDKSLWTWGTNTLGQLGDNTTATRSAISKIGSLSWAKITAGFSHMAGVTVDGALYAWGSNVFGQVGDNTTVDKSKPVLIATSNTQPTTTVSSIDFDTSLYERVNGPSLTPNVNPYVYANNYYVSFTTFGAATQNNSPQGSLNNSKVGVWIVNLPNYVIFNGDLRKTLYITTNGLITFERPAGIAGAGDYRFETYATKSASYPANNKIIISSGNTLYRLTTLSSNDTGDTGQGLWVSNDRVGGNTIIRYEGFIVPLSGDNYAFGYVPPFEIEKVNLSGEPYPRVTWNLIINPDDCANLDIHIVKQQGTENVASGIYSHDALLQPFTATDNTAIRITSTLAQPNDGIVWDDVKAGSFHTLARDTLGTLYGWGKNGNYELGDTSILDKSSPAQISTITNFLPWTTVSSSNTFSLAIDSANSSLWAWGSNLYGQLGDGTTISKITPVKIDNTTSWSVVKATANTAYAITTSGKLYVWGRNQSGQVGDGTTINKSSVTQISGSWSAVSGSDNYHSVGIKSDGSLWTWGNNTSGQLGDGTVVNKSDPVSIGSSSWSKVTAGNKFTLGITSNGNLYAWGNNHTMVLGQGDTVNRSSPVLVPSNLGFLSPKFVSTSGAYTLAISAEDSSLWAWGSNLYGQLGDGTTIFRSLPVKIGTQSWAVVSAHHDKVFQYARSVGITTDGKMYIWGNNLNSFGDNNSNWKTRTGEQKLEPFQLYPEFTYTSWKQVASGATYTLAIRGDDSSLWAWGLNTNGSLGDGTTVSKTSPVQIGSSSWSFVATDDYGSSFGITTDGKLYAWGNSGSYAGTLGDGTTTSKSSPSLVSSGGTGSWTMVAARGHGRAAIQSDGSLWTWGRQTSGVLGNNASNSNIISSPVQIGTANSWSFVSCGLLHMAAMTTTNDLFTWGSNAYRQTLGTTGTDTSNPAIITNIDFPYANDKIRAVTTGNYHTTAVSLDATSLGDRIRACGDNTYGQLGIGDPSGIYDWSHVTDGSSGVDLGDSLFTKISAGAYNTFITNNGTVYSTGLNQYGELGTPTLINMFAFDPISSDFDLTDVTAGTGSSIFARNSVNGQLAAWGLNNNGQLGFSNLNNTSVPSIVSIFKVTSNENWWANTRALSAKSNTIHAITESKKLYGWGKNRDGEIGNSSTANVYQPTQIGSSSWSFVNSSSLKEDIIYTTGGSLLNAGRGTRDRTTVFGITIDGSGYAWGNNITGQIGDNTKINKSVPTAILGSHSWSFLSGSAAHTLGVKTDGSLYAWGDNVDYNLGDGTDVDKSSPVLIMSSTANVISVLATARRYVTGSTPYFGSSTYSVGIFITSYAVTANGKIYSWGSGASGYLSNGPDGWINVGTVGVSNRFSRPSLVGTRLTTNYSSANNFTDNKSFVFVNAGADTGLITAGYNDEFDYGRSIQSTSSVDSYSFSGTVAGKENPSIIALTNDNKTYTWGTTQNVLSAIGITTTQNTSRMAYPVVVQLPFTKANTYSSWISISSTNNHVAGITTTGNLISWGANENNAHGLGWPSTQYNGNTWNNRIMQVENPYYSGSWSSVSTGNNTTFVRTTANTLFVWGKNNFGELGLGTTIQGFSPAQISGSWTIADSSSGVTSNNAMYLWGNNLSGRVGDNTNINKSAPTQVKITSAGASDFWIDFSAGNNFSYAIKTDDSLWRWGGNQNGQLGTGDTLSLSSPVQMGTDSWIAVAAGWKHTVAIAANGTLYAVGDGSVGKLGDGTAVSKSNFVKVDSTSSFTFISSQNTNFGITTANTLFAWGNNTTTGASLIFGRTTAISSPVQVTSNTESWVFAHAGKGNASFAIPEKNSANANTFGAISGGINTSAQLGDLNATAISNGNPRSLRYTDYNANDPRTKSWAQVAYGANGHAIGITTDGSLYTWGKNQFGQLGDGTTIDSFHTKKIGNSSWTSVGAGERHAAAVTVDGVVYAWGSNVFGQVGDGTTISKSSPTIISGTSSFVTVSAKANQTFAITTAGKLFAWGRNSAGELGDGTTINKSSPTQTATSTQELNVYADSDQNTWSQITDSFGIKNDGSLWAWGDNTYGQLGDGTTIYKSYPVKIGQDSWTFVTTYKYGNLTPHTAAIRSDGALFTFGRNSLGQLGDNTTINKSSPVQVTTDSVGNPLTGSWISVGTGDGFTAGILSTTNITWGSLYAWGYNGYGQLGDGTTINKSRPTKIGVLSWTAVSCGQNATYALNTAATGKLYAWGDNTYGQLGDSTLVAKSTPTAIGTLSWSMVSASQTSEVFGIAKGALVGKLYAWGYNNQSSNPGNLNDGNYNGPFALGIGSTLPYVSTPTVMPGTTSWTMVKGSIDGAALISTTGVPYITPNLGQQFIDVANTATTGNLVFYNTPLVPRNLKTDEQTTLLANNIYSNYYFTYIVEKNTNKLYGLSLGLPTLTVPSLYPIAFSSWGTGSYSSSVSGDYLVAEGFFDTSLSVLNNPGVLGWPAQLKLADEVITTNALANTKWSSIVAAANGGFAISNTGNLYSWGKVVDAQRASIAGLPAFGVNTNANGSYNVVQSRSNPAQIGAGNSWTKVNSGANGGRHFMNTLTFLTTTNNTTHILGTSVDGRDVNHINNLGKANTATIAIWGPANGGFFDYYGQQFTDVDPIQHKYYDNNTNVPTPFPSFQGYLTFKDVSALKDTSLGLSVANTLYAWGRNDLGQVGTDGTRDNQSVPVVITGSHNVVVHDSWKAISIGTDHVLAISSIDSSLWAWGTNTFGQLGDGTTDYRSRPVKIGTGSWILVSAGDQHSLAINSAYTTAGHLYAWGYNSIGALGDGTTVDKSSPVLISTSSFTVASAGAAYSGAIVNTARGLLYMWGSNSFGELGDGTTVNKSTWSAGGAIAGSYVYVSAGYTHSAAIRKNNSTLYTSGVNTYGQLGDGTTVDKSAFTLVGAPVSSSTFSKVTAGGYNTFAITTTGKIFSTGRNHVGQIGDGTQTDKSSFTALSGSFADQSWTVVSSGVNLDTDAYTADSRGPAVFAITGGPNTGLLYGWGDNTYGQLGDGTTIRKLSPVQIGSDSWTTVSTGYRRYEYPFGVMVGGIKSTGGDIFVWGTNYKQMLGDGTTIYRSSPVAIDAQYNIVSADLESKFTYVSSGSGDSIFAIAESGNIYSWGANTNSQLGLASYEGSNRDNIVSGNVIQRNINTNTFFNYGDSWTIVSGDAGTPVNDPFSGVVMAIRHSDSSLWGFGNNTFGQIGDGTTIHRSTPVKIGSSSWLAVSTSAEYTVAITTGFTLYAWGRNLYGQLGDGTTVNKSTPTAIGALSWAAVSALDTSTVGLLKNTGALFTWGRNINGQLGSGTTVDRSSPVQVGTSSYTMVNAKGTGTNIYAIGIDGSLYAWGDNAYGQIGDATKVNRSSPVRTFNYDYSSFKMVASGNHTLAIANTDGSLWVWGRGNEGQLGDGTTVSKSSPTQLGTSSWTFVSVGASHSVGITTDGNLYVWGNNASGQLGDGTTVGGRSSPTLVPTFVNSWSDVATGNSFTMAISSLDSSLWTWGRNFTGNLGDGTTVNKSSPVKIGTSSWAKVAAANNTAYGITSDGKLFAWGSGNFGALGDGTTINKSSPVQIGAVGSSWTFVASDSRASHAVAITTGGIVYAWGFNGSGQVGDGTTVNKSSPALLGGAVSTFFNTAQFSPKADVGFLHTAAILSSNSAIFAWGDGRFGSLGDTSTVNRSAPVVVSGAFSWSAVSAGNNHTVGITNEGTLYAWGFNSNSQLGDGTTINKSSPVLVSTTAGVWSNVSSGMLYSEAINNSGELYAWGADTNGQLGDAGGVNRISPAKIGTNSWIKVSTGVFNTTAIDTTGNLYAWGINTFGNLGDGTTIAKSTPTVILYVPYSGDDEQYSWIAVAAGQGHVNAIRKDNSLWSWGLNTFGALGDGTVASKSSAVQIGSSSWTKVGAGYNHVYGMKPDGTIQMWGLGLSGQLGDNTVATKSSPVSLGGGFDTTVWKEVSLGGLHTAAVRNSDNLVYVWGNNTNGRLGDGTTINKSTPTALAGGFATSLWTSISAGNTHSLAIRTDGQLFGWGLNSTGELGDGTTISKSSPVAISTSSHSFIEANRMLTGSAAISDGDLYMWGINTLGIIGDGTTVNKSSRAFIGKAVISKVFSSWSFVAAAGQTRYAIRTDGSLWVWGRGDQGQLGDNTTIDKSKPVQIGTSSWTIIAGRTQSVHGIDINEKLYAWGLNTTGQLGDGTTISKSEPVQIGTSSWTSVSGTRAGITLDGALYTWGLNSTGQLGDGTTINKSSPVYVTTTGGSSAIAKIISGDGAVYILDKANTILTIGGNTDGQLGDGTTINRNYLSRITDRLFKDIDSGDNFVVATHRTNGSIYSWGNNQFGQLGDGTTISKSTPTLANTSSWTIISVGGSHVAGVTSTNTLFTWGGNQFGQLGDGTTVNKSSPTQITTYKFITNIHTGENFTLKR